MTQHYQKNVCGVLMWCNTCNRKTMHAVYNKRVGTCTETHVVGMSRKQEKQKQQEQAAQVEEPTLF